MRGGREGREGGREGVSEGKEGGREGEDVHVLVCKHSYSLLSSN